MSFVISTKISEMQKELNTISGQKVSDDDFILFLDRANKYFYTNCKMPTCERESDLLIFAGVNEYALPSDFIRIITPKRPYGLHSPTFDHETSKSFVHWLHENKTAIKWVRETPYLLVNEISLGSSQIIHDFASVSDNGTWSISGDGSSLIEDDQIFVEGSASLRFTITAAGGTTTLTNSTIAQTIDLTDYVSQGWTFLDLGCPLTNSVAISQIELRLGSSASNYYKITSTARYRGDGILNGFGLIGFDLSTKTTVGTPVDTAINYAQVIITNGLTGVNGTYRIDNLFVSLAEYFQLPYYSKNNVKDQNGAYIASPTAISDTILCPFDFEEAITYKCLELISAQRLKDESAASYFARELKPKEAALKADYPTQESRPSTTWYKRAKDF